MFLGSTFSQVQFEQFVRICNQLVDPRLELSYWVNVFQTVEKPTAELDKKLPRTRDLLALRNHRGRLFRELIAANSERAKQLVREAHRQEFVPARRLKTEVRLNEEEAIKRQSSY